MWSWHSENESWSDYIPFSLTQGIPFWDIFPQILTELFSSVLLFLPYSSVGRSLLQVVPCPQSATSAPAISSFWAQERRTQRSFCQVSKRQLPLPLLDAQNATPGLLAKAAKSPPPSYSMHHFTAQTLLSSEFALNQFLHAVSLQTTPGEWITSPMRLLLHSRAAFPSESD